MDKMHVILGRKQEMISDNSLESKQLCGLNGWPFGYFPPYVYGVRHGYVIVLRQNNFG